MHESERERILFRGVAHYGAGMHMAFTCLTSGRLIPELPPLPRDLAVPSIRNAGEARRWTETKFLSVLAAMEQAAEVGGAAAATITWSAECAWHYCYHRYDWAAIDRLVDAVAKATRQGG